MGGEPWMIRKPFFESPERVLQKHKMEILKATPDWPEIVLTDGRPVKLPGWPQPTTSCTISPLPENLLDQAFGTDEPDSTMTDEQLEQLLEDCFVDRGEGYFIILYKEGNPHEVCFYGCSFD